MEDNKENVVVLQENGGLKPRRWTFHRYLKGIAFGKWVVLASTVVLGAIGYVGMRFGVNEIRETVESKFSLEGLAINLDGKGGGTFYDGSPFNYASIISSDALTTTKTANPRYKDVNIDKLMASISISMEELEDKETGAISYPEPNRFTITAKRSAFKNADIAKSFIRDVVDKTATRALDIVNRHSLTIVVPENLETFSFVKQLEYLEAQYAVMLEELGALNAKFLPSASTNASGLSLRGLNSEFRNAFLYQNVEIFDYLLSQLNANSWVNFTEENIEETIQSSLENAEGFIEIIREELIESITLKERLAELASMYGSGSEITARQAVTYSQRLTEIETNRAKNLGELRRMGLNVEEFTANPTEENLLKISADLKNKVFAPDGYYSLLCEIRDGHPSAATEQWALGCKIFGSSVQHLNYILIGEGQYKDRIDDATHYLYRTTFANVTYYYSGGAVIRKSLSPWIGAIGGAVFGFLASSIIVTFVYIGRIDPHKDPKVEEDNLRKKAKKEAAK